MEGPTLKQPSAYLPISMSGFCILMFAFVLLTGIGVAPDGDEGAAAHIFQLLMAGQLPIIAFFAAAWLPRNPGKALAILALQLLAALGAMAPVWYVEHHGAR